MTLLAEVLDVWLYIWSLVGFAYENLLCGCIDRVVAFSPYFEYLAGNRAAAHQQLLTDASESLCSSLD
jgi:hypothetical protein